MSALDKLIEAVEAGTAPEFSIFREAHGKGTVWRSLPSLSRHDAHRAYNGSLDAALALHEALLPGWDWGVSAGPIQGVNGYASLLGWQKGESEAEAETPARAWLLAILRAYRSLQEAA